MLAVGLVIFVTIMVGIIAHACFPALPWAACFILGAIVSPTDTVAAQAIIERLHIPRRITAILGGESLVNDATGLVGVQIGVTVVLSGVFTIGDTLITFSWVAGIGLLMGLLMGVFFAWVNTWVRDTTTLFLISLVAPFAAFQGAHHVHASGVLAVVVAGFFVSWRIHQVPSASRVPLYHTWELLTAVLNGFCFHFIGLEAPRLLGPLTADGWWPLIGAGLIAAALIAARIIWCFPAAYVPLLLSRRLRQREQGYPAPRHVFLLSWCGMRGVVSLAAALALPMTTTAGEPFPGRDLMIACTVVVIGATLLVQGLTLQPLITLLGIRGDEQGEQERHTAQEAILAAGIARLDAYCNENSCPVAVHHLRQAMADHLQTFRDQDEVSRSLAGKRLAVSREVQNAVREAQSTELLRLRDRQIINDSTYVELQLELDRLAE